MSVNEFYLQLINGLIVQLIAFSVNSWHYIRLSAHGQDEPARPLGPEGAPGLDPGRGPGAPSVLGGRAAMSHEPRDEYDAKN